MVVLAVVSLVADGRSATVNFDFSSGIGADFTSVDSSGGLWSVNGSDGKLQISKLFDDGTINGYRSIQGGLESKFTLAGDFTVDVDFQLNTFPNANSGWNGSVLMVQRVGSGQLFEVLRWAKPSEQLVEVYGDPGGQVGNKPEGMLGGTYRITRSGKTIAGFIASSGSTEFTEIGRVVESFDQPALIRLVGMQVSLAFDTQPRSTTAMDIRFDNLTVTADQITGLSQVPEPATVLQLLGFAACAMVLGRRFRRRF